MPKPNDKYCMKHLEEETPVITADTLTTETKRALRDRRKSNANYQDAGQDNMLLSPLKRKIELKFKWLGFDITDCTWKPEKAIPKFFRKYYKDKSNPKTKLPNPVIKPLKPD